MKTIKIDWKYTYYCVYADVYRNTGKFNKKILIKEFLSNKSTVSLLIYYRLCRYYANKRKNLFEYLIHAILYRKFCKKQVTLGIELNQRTEIGYGIRLPHRGGIVIHPKVNMGNNCEIMQGVTIGNNILKSRTEVAIIGDNVILGAGSKVIGPVTIGSNVIIGANAVVTHDIQNNCTAAGLPAKVISPLNDNVSINIDYSGRE
ncbi:serine acetyltransferase [Priestia megaterium]|uniref:serine O-acetyltransferase n=1 Tax=Priestia megaterium TaxID=1404 RepID=UPI001B3A481C|nr:serine acetyltransferase [Priestia megaterium]MBQ4867835.1 serine acetyltransferase [Priestia megaterium]